MNKELILIVATADNCGHCKILKPNLPGLTDALHKEHNNLRVLHLNTANMHQPDFGTQEHPKSFVNIMPKWFPSFSLTSSKAWEAAIKDNSTLQTLVAFNAERKANGSFEMIANGRLSPNAPSISKWIAQQGASLLSSASKDIPDLKNLLDSPPTKVGNGNKLPGQAIPTDPHYTGNLDICSIKLVPRPLN